MAFDEEYRELVEDARDALRKLFDESEHDSWGVLRIGYGSLREALARDDKACERDERAAAAAAEKAEQKRQHDTWQAARDEAEKQWLRLPRERRETLVLQALGDDRLVIREITERMNRELGYPQPIDGHRITALYGGEVSALVRRMWRQGQLDREAETFNVSHTRYRYFPRRRLDGPIADIERRLKEA